MVQRSASAESGALVSLWGLLGLFVIKGTVGLLTGSKALIADACHSGADWAGAMKSYLGIRKARTTANGRIPKSEQAESTTSIILSVLLLVAAIEIGISAIRALVNGVDHAPGWGAVILVAASIGLREGIVRYKRNRDHRSGLRADRDGDNRSDILVSLTALIGTSGALVGEMYEMPILFVLDPAAGLVISLIIVRTSYRLTADVLRNSDRCVLDEADAQALLEAVQRVDGVISVDHLRAREQGHYLVLDIDIRVNPRLSVFEGQDIALRVKRQLTKRFLHVMDAQIKVQPYDPGFPYKSNHHDEQMSSLLQ